MSFNLKLEFKQLLFFIVLFFLGLGVGSSHAQAQKSPDSVPDFTFYRLDGSAFTKAQMTKNKRSIFILFDCTCGHCEREILNLGQQYADFKEVVFYLVTLDQKAAIDKFMSSYGRYLKGKNNVVLLRDPKNDFILKFVPKRYPGVFVYDIKGKALLSKSGPTPPKEILSVLEKKQN